MWVFVSFSLSVLCCHNKGCGQVSPQNISRSFSLYNKPILAYIYKRIYVYNKRNNDLNESLLIKFWHTVYGVIFGLLYLWRVSSRLVFARKKLCWKRDNLKHWNSPRHKYARWRRGHEWKWNGDEYFPVFHLFKVRTTLYMHVILFRLILRRLEIFGYSWCMNCVVMKPRNIDPK